MSTMLSRVADHLYWLGRYLERAEHTARILNVQTHLALEDTAESRKRKLADLLRVLDQPELEASSFQEASLKLSLDADNHSSVRSCVRNARENARQIRDRISSEMWEQINRVHLQVESRADGQLFEARPQQFFHDVITGMHLTNGLTDSTVSRDQAWLFIQTGRWLERAGLLVTLLDTYMQDFDEKGYVDWLGLLKCCTAFEAFRKKLGVELEPLNIADFLMLSQRFPHSLLFSISMLRRSLVLLADETENKKGKKLERVVGKLHHELEYARPEEILGDRRAENFKRFKAELSKIHSLVYRLYISWEVEF